MKFTAKVNIIKEIYFLSVLFFRKNERTTKSTKVIPNRGSFKFTANKIGHVLKQ